MVSRHSTYQHDSLVGDTKLGARIAIESGKVTPKITEGASEKCTLVATRLRRARPLPSGRENNRHHDV